MQDADFENWFANGRQQTEQSVLDKMMDIAHYQKSKFDAANKFRMVSDNSDCGYGGH